MRKAATFAELTDEQLRALLADPRWAPTRRRADASKMTLTAMESTKHPGAQVAGFEPGRPKR